MLRWVADYSMLPTKSELKADLHIPIGCISALEMLVVGEAVGMPLVQEIAVLICPDVHLVVVTVNGDNPVAETLAPSVLDEIALGVKFHYFLLAIIPTGKFSRHFHSASIDEFALPKVADSVSHLTHVERNEFILPVERVPGIFIV